MNPKRDEFEKPGDDKILQQPPGSMARRFENVEVEPYLFTPEEDDYCCEYMQFVSGHRFPRPGELLEACDLCAVGGTILPVRKDAVGFQTKDSGQRQEFSTGMVRDTSADKPRYDLIWQPGIKRVAELMARGASKYSARNWEKASTQEELDRFKESALRHMYQWLEGDRTEDHMAAVVFNLFGAEFVLEKLK